jgi:hypothetical protein
LKSFKINNSFKSKSGFYFRFIAIEELFVLWYNIFMNKIVSFFRKHELLFFLIIFALGAFLRFYRLSELPYGLNPDEASAGYEAFSILNYGIDRNGYSYPVLLKSWGSGQNVLYTYLAIPYVGILDLSELSVRLPMAIMSTISLFVFWLLCRKTRGKGFAIIALFFLAIAPWHILSARWALESNLLPHILLFAIYFTVLAEEKQVFLLPASFFFALSLYAYGTALMFTPLILLYALRRFRKKIELKFFLPALLFFLTLGFPIVYCQLRNALQLPATKILDLGLPALNETRQSAVMSFDFSELFGNFFEALKVILLQSDGLAFNYSRVSGLYYPFGILFLFIGLVSAIRKKEKRAADGYFFAGLVISLFLCFFIKANVNRINFVWIFLSYFVALGVYNSTLFLEKFALLLPILFILNLGIFAQDYVSSFNGNKTTYYYPGLGAAIEYVSEQDPQSVYITRHVNQPYIYILFYEKISPHYFMENVSFYDDSAAFCYAKSLGKYNFEPSMAGDSEWLILFKSEAHGLNIEKSFYNFAVVRKK